MADTNPGLDAVDPNTDLVNDIRMGAPMKATAKGLTPAGNIAMDPTQTAELLANMENMVNERTGAWNTFLGGLKDAAAWGSGGVQGPSQALALREADKAKEFQDVYNMRQQMASLKAAQAQQEAYNEEQKRIFGGGGAGAGGMGTGAPQMYKGVQLDPETAVAMAQARTREERDKIFNDFASKRSQARGSFEFGAPSYKTDIDWINPVTKKLEQIDAITAKRYKDAGFGQVLGPAAPQAGAPMSVRNNNPGNIVDQKTGQIKTFATPEEGERALDADLKLKLSGESPAYKARFGNEPITPARLAETWAPAGAKGNSPESTANYGKYIAKSLGIGVDDKIENTPENLGKAKAAIRQFEAGAYNVAPAQTVSTANVPTIPEAKIAAAGQKSKAEAQGTAAGKYLGGAEATVREAGSTAGERLSSLEYLNGLITNPQTSRVFGVFQKPGFMNGVGNVIQKGITLGRLGEVGIKDLDSLVVANMKDASQQEIDAAQKATREFAKIKLNEAKILLAGQGSVSDAERGLVQELSGSRMNSPGALKDYLAWGKMRAEYDRDVSEAFKQYRRTNRGASFEDFLDTGRADELRDAYDDKLFKFAAKTGIDLSKTSGQPQATPQWKYSDDEYAAWKKSKGLK